MSSIAPLTLLTTHGPDDQATAQVDARAPEVRWSRVLTAEPGPFHVEPEQREVICILSDAAGTRAQLVVSGAHRVHPLALSFANRLKLAEPKVTFDTRYAPVSEIVGLYERLAGRSDTDGASTTDQQELIKSYIREAARLGASDLKFNIVGPLCRLRYTIHGRTNTYHELPAAEGYALCRTLYNTMTDEINGTGLDENVMQDGQLSVAVAKQCGLVGSRIATRPAKSRGLRMTLRLLPPNDSSANLESLGYLPDEQVPIIRELTRLKFGIALFSGVTGSGKSTSLKACIEEILVSSNQETDIITIEDPTEYDIEGEGCLQTPLTWRASDPGAQKAAWANALRNCMRHAPNVLMPGEIRDAESAVTAYDAAMTGHFIWSTLHVFDAPSILVRLRRLGVDEDLLFNPALSVGLINQALVRTICPGCRIPYKEGAHRLEPALRERIETFCTTDTVYLAGDGCELCKDKTPGTKGRLVAAEIIRTTAEFMRVFQNDGMNAARIYWVREMGGITKIAHAIRHINAGITDPRHAEQDVGPLNTDRIHLGI